MPIYKVVHNLKQYGRGWGEVYYQDASSARTAATLSLGQINDFMGIRSFATILRSVRASNVAPPRDSVTITYNASAPGSSAVTYRADVVSTSLLAHWVGILGGQRNVWIRGVRDEAVMRNADGSPNFTQITTPLAAYRSMVLSKVYRIRSIQGGVVGPAQLVGTVAKNADNPSLTDVPVFPANLPIGTLLLFSRIPKHLCGFPREAITLTASAVPVATILYRLRNADGSSPVGNVSVGDMRVRVVTALNYAVCDLLQPIDFTSRQTGRPTDLPRGRKSAGCRRR